MWHQAALGNCFQAMARHSEGYHCLSFNRFPGWVELLTNSYPFLVCRRSPWLTIFLKLEAPRNFEIAANLVPVRLDVKII